jgi:uncharacterized protein involved in exopolysaccharide biosynthesis
VEMEISLQDYVDVILRHWPVVLAVFLVATVVATAVSFLQPSIYEASTTLVEESYEYLDTPRLSSRDRTVIKHSGQDCRSGEGRSRGSGTQPLGG